MKRSEMINLMAETLEQYELLRYNSRIISDILLKTVESAGMLPPGYMKPIPFESGGKQYPLVPGDFPNEKGIWCTPGQHEWEPENESK